jgi:hypothetical protein
MILDKDLISLMAIEDMDASTLKTIHSFRDRESRSCFQVLANFGEPKQQNLRHPLHWFPFHSITASLVVAASRYSFLFNRFEVDTTSAPDFYHWRMCAHPFL